MSRYLGPRLPSWSLLLALAGSGAACQPELSLRTPPPDAAAPPQQEASAPVEASQPETSIAPCPRIPSPPTPPGLKEAGQACDQLKECRRDLDEVRLCEPINDPRAPDGTTTCHRLVRAKLGDACWISITSSGAQWWALPPGMGFFPSFSAYCDFQDGLECDAAERRCLPLPKLGESCTTRPFCARGSFCQGATCVEALPLGAPCANLEESQCSPSTQCEALEIRNTCQPLLGAGKACARDDWCESGACRNTHCTAPGDCPPPESVE